MQISIEYEQLLLHNNISQPSLNFDNHKFFNIIAKPIIITSQKFRDSSMNVKWKHPSRNIRLGIGILLYTFIKFTESDKFLSDAVYFPSFQILVDMIKRVFFVNFQT